MSGVITDSESYSIHWRHLLRIDSTVLQGNILMGNLKIRNIFIIISRIFLLLKHSLEGKFVKVSEHICMNYMHLVL